MKSKKFFAKALAFAMVMGTVGMHGVAASPVSVVKADVAAPTVTVDYEKFTADLTLDSGDTSNYICLQILKDAAGSKVSSEIWYEVSSSKATVDLSFLKISKAQYIRAYSTAGGESEIFTVAAQPKTSIKYDAKKQEFTDKAKTVLNDLTGFEFKTLYGGTWTADLSNFDIDAASFAGATVVVRTKAVTTANATATTPAAPAGTEVKVKISAVAKAPKVKTDYAKGIITLPKGVEVKVAGDTDFVEMTGKLTPEDLLGKLNKTDTQIATLMSSGFDLVVRTAEVTGKKPASNMAVIAVKPSSVLTIDSTSKGVIDYSGSSSQTVVVTDGRTGAKVTFAQKDSSVSTTDGILSGIVTVTYAAGSGSSDNNSTFIYSIDDGKTWKKLGTATSAADMATLNNNAKFKVSVEAPEGTFAPKEVEITYKTKAP